MFTIHHDSLARQLGLSPAELTALAAQHLTPDHDYTRKTRATRYTEDGARKLTAAIQAVSAPAQSPDPSPTEKSAPAPASASYDPAADVLNNATRYPVEVRLYCWSCLRDGRTIEAYREGSDPSDPKNRVRVRVRDNRHFHRLDSLGRPMTLIAIQTGEKQYELKGRPPQYPRRWSASQPH